MVRRVDHVYPVYRLGHEEHQEVLEAWADGRDELVLFGRQPLFAHDNTHHALAMGRGAASCLGPAGAFDAARWRALRDQLPRPRRRGLTAAGAVRGGPRPAARASSTTSQPT